MIKREFNQWLDVCRASAILLVLLSHGRWFLTPVFPEANVFKFGGFLGVELFFVLSGFLIGKILLDKLGASETATGWILSFWGRRWLRTFPNYLLFLLVNLFILNSIRPDVFPSVVRYLTFTQSLVNAHPSFFAEAWSLAVEELFYFIAPLMVALLIAITNNKRLGLRVAVLFLIVGPFVLRAQAAVFGDMSFNDIRSTAIYRVDSIMIGMLTMVFFKRHGIGVVAKLGLLFIPICIYVASQADSFLDNSEFFKVFLFPMANLGFSCLICCGYHLKIDEKIMYFFSRVARWSYAGYLTNLPCFFLIRYLLPPPASFASCIFQWLLFFFLTLASAAIIYTFFEKPVMKFRDRLIVS